MYYGNDCDVCTLDWLYVKLYNSQITSATCRRRRLVCETPAQGTVARGICNALAPRHHQVPADTARAWLVSYNYPSNLRASVCVYDIRLE